MPERNYQRPAASMPKTVNQPVGFQQIPSRIHRRISTLAKFPDGRIGINPYKMNTDIYYLTFDEVQGTGDSLLVVPPGTTRSVTATNDRSGWIEIFKIMGTSTGVYEFEIEDHGAKRKLMNRAIHRDTLIGNGPRPFILPCSLWLEPSRSLGIAITDLTSPAVGVNVRMTFGARRFYHDARQNFFAEATEEERYSRPYIYTTDSPVQLPAAATEVNAFITIANDSDFEASKLMVFSTGDFRIQINNSGNARQISNSWINAASVFGNNEYPYILPESWLIPRNTQLRLRMLNLSGAINNVFFSMAGTAFYYPEFVNLTDINREIFPIR